MDVGKFQYEDSKAFTEESFWGQPYFKFPAMYTIALCIMLPLCLIKNISNLRFFSIFGILSLILVMILIVVQSPFFLIDYYENDYKEDDPKTHLNIWDIGSGFTDDFYFFKGTATIFYAYTCHIGAFPIMKGLKNNVNRRIQKVFKRAIVTDAILYILVGTAGFFTVPFQTPDLIIMRKSIFNNDILMTIGRLAIVLTLMVKIPAKYNLFRLSFMQLVFNESGEISNKKNLLVTLPTLLITVTIGALYSDISRYISLLGSFCSVIIAFIFPCIYI